MASLYLFFAAYQLLRPFQTPHQARFAGHLRPLSVAAADLGGAATVLLATWAALSFPGHQARGSWQVLLAAAAFLATLEAVFWCVAVARVSAAHQAPLVSGTGVGPACLLAPWRCMQPACGRPALCRLATTAMPVPPQGSLWRSLFLPIVPPTFVLLQALAIQVMRSTESGLATLRAVRYDYKRA